jgi:predicted RNase H-like nuclease
MTMVGSARRAVLGVDAAWTATQPSGVALAVETERGWRLAALDASYDNFVGRANGGPPIDERPRGSMPNAKELLDAATKRCGRPIDLVAVDMPMSRQRIKERRRCDNEISRCYGTRGAATHSPSADRPGKISGPLREGFENEKYRLCAHWPAQGLIEVYPHPALIEFFGKARLIESFGRAFRVPYKAAKIGIYWRNHSPEDRRMKLFNVWAHIVDRLQERIAGIGDVLKLPLPNDPGWRLKAYEDRLDAVVCAAVPVACLDGQAVAHGDDDAAIWVPAPDVAV